MAKLHPSVYTAEELMKLLKIKSRALLHRWEQAGKVPPGVNVKRPHGVYRVWKREVIDHGIADGTIKEFVDSRS